jgi:hypothetical protein
MFDQNLAHAAGDRLSLRCQKHAKSDSQMSALQIGASMLFSLRWLRLMLRLEIFHVRSLPPRKR